MDNQNWANRISELCFQHFKILPKTGKPTSKEWTVLACIVQFDSITDDLIVVSLGTGSKCIGGSQLSDKGDIVNDSHAEVIARRGFLRYVYHQLSLSTSSSIFALDETNNTFILKETISFHFFCTQTPCGDASIFPKNIHNLENLDILNNQISVTQKVNSLKRQLSEISEISSKYQKIDNESFSDIYRTGAKCLEISNLHDPKLSGKDYHILGVIRTKPGRGDPTLSVSCSDKLSKWCALGIQGALLSTLILNPIYFKTITIASGVSFSLEAMQRALINRWDPKSVSNIPAPFNFQIPLIRQADNDLVIDFNKRPDMSPCSMSIVWARVQQKPLEIIVMGRKSGVTKAHLNTSKGRASICKKNILKEYLSILDMYPSIKKNISFDQCTTVYFQLKQNSILYQKGWQYVKKYCFQHWTTKPPIYLNFNINDE